MKKVLIVNNNMDVGGIQKSLIGFLNSACKQYDITLMLFSKTGPLLSDIPKEVKVITPSGRYRMLGLTKQELKSSPFLFVLKSFLITFTKFFSRRGAMRILGLFQKKIKGYDTVIAYSHLSHHNYFWNGSGDFVLDKTVSDNKICLIHCDYINSGCMTDKNNKEYAEFDKIACCSDSVRGRFIEGSKIDPQKVYTLRNFYDFNIVNSANQDPYEYDSEFLNIITVARLSSEKGIGRAIEALFNTKRTDIRYYVVGNGPLMTPFIEKVKAYGMENQVFFLGEQYNPYRYMRNADYLLLSSFHEAAPIVFDEANILGLNVISTKTTSAAEMLTSSGDIVCDNSKEGIENALLTLKKTAAQKVASSDNAMQLKQLSNLI